MTPGVGLMHPIILKQRSRNPRFCMPNIASNSARQASQSLAGGCAGVSLIESRLTSRADEGRYAGRYYEVEEWNHMPAGRITMRLGGGRRACDVLPDD